jgi:N-acetylglucosaminyl-diphospho-decaprenol L-rhamnosyltransferase
MSSEVTIVLLNWNSAKYLSNCYDSIKKQIDCSWELIIVDNGSTESESLHLLDCLEKENVKIIRNKVNMGIAPARNQGLKLIKTKYGLILDSDTILSRHALRNMIDFMNENAIIGILGPKLLYENGDLQYSCRKFPTLMGKVGRRLNIYPFNKMAKNESMLGENYNQPFTVDYVIGAAQLVRMEMYHKVGGLDGKMFYGPEDVDFCIRCWKAGWEVWYLPKVKIIHYEQRITKTFRKIFTSKTGRAHLIALIRYFLKHGGLFKRPKLKG